MHFKDALLYFSIGCYRFSDGSFMHYLDYSQTNPKMKISAPIFKEHDRSCNVREIFKFIRDGKEWKGNGSDLFYINNGKNKDTKVFKVNRLEGVQALRIFQQVSKCGHV